MQGHFIYILKVEPLEEKEAKERIGEFKNHMINFSKLLESHDYKENFLKTLKKKIFFTTIHYIMLYKKFLITLLPSLFRIAKQYLNNFFLLILLNI